MTIDTVLFRIRRALELIAGTLFLLLFAVNVLNITLRNFMGVSWLWIPGISRLFFIWTVFLGTAVLYDTNDHLVMDFFFNRFRPATRKRIWLFINLLFLVFLVILIIYGFNIVQVRMGIPFETWNFPTAYAYLAAPVSGILMLAFCLNKLRKLIMGGNDE